MEKIIIVGPEFDDLYNMSVYEYIENKLEKNKNFIICHVTHEEFDKMKQQIKRFNTLYERLSCQTGEDYGYDNKRWMGLYDKKTESLRLANYENYNEIGSYSFNRENGLSFDENKYNFVKAEDCPYLGDKVYTTETYEDMIDYLKNYKIKIDYRKQLTLFTHGLIDSLYISSKNRETLKQSIKLLNQNKISFEEYDKLTKPYQKKKV